MSIKKLRRYLQQQFDVVASLDREYDPDYFVDIEVGQIVGEARRRCCELGFEEIGEEVNTLSPRDALPILGKLLTWAQERRSETDAMSPPKVAKMFGVKPDKVLYWIHSGQLEAVNIAKDEGHRPQYAVTPAGLDTFTRRRATRAPVRTRRTRRPSSGKVYV